MANYAKIYRADIANGQGFRVSLFVSGCARNCPGCFNKEAQDPSFGKLFDDKAKQKLFKELEHEWCRGISFLGGEPLSKLSDNRKVIIELAKEIREKFPDKTIFLWSGYLFEEILEDKSMKGILDYIDVLIDGPFIEEKKDRTLKWRGSSNQHIIDVAKWRQTGEVSYIND